MVIKKYLIKFTLLLLLVKLVTSSFINSNSNIDKIKFVSDNRNITQNEEKANENIINNGSKTDLKTKENSELNETNGERTLILDSSEENQGSVEIYYSPILIDSDHFEKNSESTNKNGTLESYRRRSIEYTWQKIKNIKEYLAKTENLPNIILTKQANIISFLLKQKNECIENIINSLRNASNLIKSPLSIVKETNIKSTIIYNCELSFSSYISFVVKVHSINDFVIRIDINIMNYYEKQIEIFDFQKYGVFLPRISISIGNPIPKGFSLYFQITEIFRENNGELIKFSTVFGISFKTIAITTVTFPETKLLKRKNSNFYQIIPPKKPELYFVDVKPIINYINNVVDYFKKFGKY